MILFILFIVFFVLWGVAEVTVPAYTRALAWVCVGLLALQVFATHIR